MKKTALKLIFLAFAVGGLFPAVLGGFSQRGTEEDFKDNRCVKCHSTITSPISLSTRFYDWYTSKQKEKGVSCEQCHGGDPKAIETEKAHAGVVPPSKAESRLSQSNLPETCEACHKDIVAAFVQSMHYQKLKSAGGVFT